MVGSHCLKSWAKTQAVIAKSSAEAELYAVVRGATEGLGMLTLFGDLGQQARLQLHLDASAAKSIIERRGLSKVRHIDVNVLWLQDTCARREIPLNKVPGEENCADMMTKHLTSDKLNKNLCKMRIENKDGRSAKAANLHSLQEAVSPEWSALRKKFEDDRGGDRWLSRGHKGLWQRMHSSPRISLFTPFKVSKGPSAGMPLQSIRFTKGITKSGHRFEFQDNWQQAERRHHRMDEEWIGFTVFVALGESIYDSLLTANRQAPAVDL